MKTPYAWRHGDDGSREAAWARVIKIKYDEVARERLPDRIRALLEQLDDAESRERCPGQRKR